MAAGFAFAALGTDDGGSNRIPSQFTGVVCMKPTFGLVPRTGVETVARGWEVINHPNARGLVALARKVQYEHDRVTGGNTLA